MKIISLLFLFLFNVVCHGENEDFLETLYEWKYIEYKWESDDQKKNAISSGDYNVSASTPIDVDIASDSRVFVTIMRTAGVPATLGIVTNETGDGGPLVQPYPDWESNKGKDCEGFLNVYRIAIDKCNQLWVLDSGMVDDEYKCPAKMVVFDLLNDTIINTFDIERDLYKGALKNFVVHYSKTTCMNPAIFMADTLGNGMVIYDGKQFCRFESNYFEGNSEASTFTVDGESFTKLYGLLGMAIRERTDHHLQEAMAILYFRALSSFDIYWYGVDTLTAYCETKFPPSVQKSYYKTSTQSVVLAVANKIMFSGGIETTSLNCYNTNKYFNNKTNVMLIQDNERLQWISGIKAYPKTLEWAQKLIMLSNRYQKVFTHTMDSEEVNYRILNGNADELTYQTRCY